MERYSGSIEIIANQSMERYPGGVVICFVTIRRGHFPSDAPSNHRSQGYPMVRGSWEPRRRLGDRGTSRWAMIADLVSVEKETPVATHITQPLGKLNHFVCLQPICKMLTPAHLYHLPQLV
jgi:hypothetical protein